MSDCHRELLENLGIRAKIIVPILQGQTLWGLLCTSQTHSPRQWQPEEINFLQQISTQLAIAIKQATAYQQIETELAERRKIEAALSESQNLYATLVNSVPVGIFRVDPQGDSIYVNEYWCLLTEFTQEEALGKGWIQTIHFDDRDKFVFEWDLAVQENRLFQSEYRHQRPDGSIIWVFMQAIPEYNTNGEFIGYIGSINDITEKKQSYKILENLIAGTSSVTEKDFFLSLAEHIKNAFDLDRIVITEFNHGVFCKIVDLSNNQFQTDPIDEDLDYLYAKSDIGIALQNQAGKSLGYIALWYENVSTSNQIINITDILRVFASRAEVEIERIRATETLQQRNQELSQAKSALEEFNQSLEDMVRQKTQEVLKLNIIQKAILDGADYSIISTDLNGIIQSFNLGATKLLGYSSEEMIGKVTPEIIHDRTEVANQAQILSQQFNRTIEPGFEVFVAPCREGIIYEQEWTYIRKDGSRFPVLLSISPLKDINQQTIGFLGIAKDISQRKQTEAKLQQLSHSLTLALKSGKMGYWEWDIRTNIIIWDEQMYELYGLPKQAETLVVYDVWANGVHPDDRIPTETLLQQAVLEQAEYNTEFRVVHPDGSIHFIKAFGLLVKDTQGNPESMLGVNFDITQLKQTQEKLNTEKVRLQVALAAAKMGTVIDNLTTDELILSDRTQEIFGFVQGNCPSDRATFIAMIHPEDREQVIQAIADSIKAGKVFQTEYRIYRLDGEIRWVTYWGMMSPHLYMGKQEIIGVVADITERKQAEESSARLASIVASSEDAIISKTLDGIINTWNLGAEKIFGYTSEEIVGQDITTLFPPNHRDEENHILSQIRAGKPIKDYETIRRRKDGSLIYVSISVSPIKDKYGKIIEISTILRDISKSKKYEEQLEKTNQELAHATRLKDKFLANMSHELRTPLNAILGMSEALQEEVFGTLNEKQHNSVQTIESSGTHLLSLINDILDLAKIESGKIELDYTHVSIKNLCDSSLVFIKQQAMQKQIKVHTDIPPYLPDLLVDERRIRQVLINLLTNAVKFTQECGRISLKVRIESNKLDSSVPTSQVCFAITDNGIGITQENLAKLFQPFVQIDSALNRQYAGTGLGLILVKQIVEMHGGQIKVNSEFGVGSCFAFSLPYKDFLGQNLNSDYPTTYYDQNSLTSSTEPTLILLAEDNQANLITISRYLKAKGYEIILAKDGQEAIEIAKSQSLDLILMDIQMPGMDGLEAIKRLRQDSDRQVANIPIIALTALAMKGDKEKCLEAGANDYLSKPLKLSQLVVVIQEILAKSKKS